MSLQAFREQRAGIAKTLNELVGKKEWDPAADQAIYDKAMADIDKIDAAIKRINDANEALARDSATLALAEGAERQGRDQGKPGLTAYAKWLKGGDKALNAEDWSAVRATMSTAVPAEGGFTVPETTVANVIERLRAFGGMRRVADVIVTASGELINYPTSDGTSEEGEIVAENVSATDLDVSFGTVGLGVYKFSSKVVTVPYELLQDSAIDVAAFVENRIVTRLGRVTNRMFTTGTGSGQPHGVVVAATVGITAGNGTSQVTAVTYDSLSDLQHTVDPAYREMGNVAYMFNDDTLSKVRKIKDGQQRPIFVPGYESNNPGGAPDRLLGLPIVINQNMANMAANARSILCGDFTGYVIRDAMGLTMFRFDDSAYAKRGQVGFLAWTRSGGNLVDTGKVRVFVNAAS
jgi:HK97 family phage major capsid protein